MFGSSDSVFGLLVLEGLSNSYFLSYDPQRTSLIRMEDADEATPKHFSMSLKSPLTPPLPGHSESARTDVIFLI